MGPMVATGLRGGPHLLDRSAKWGVVVRCSSAWFAVHATNPAVGRSRFVWLAGPWDVHARAPGTQPTTCDQSHESLRFHPLDSFPGKLTHPRRSTGIHRPRTAPDRGLPAGVVAPTRIRGRSPEGGTRGRSGAPTHGEPQLASRKERSREVLSHQDPTHATDDHHRRIHRCREGLGTHGPRRGNNPDRRDRPTGHPPVDHFDPSLNPSRSTQTTARRPRLPSKRRLAHPEPVSRPGPIDFSSQTPCLPTLPRLRPHSSKDRSMGSWNAPGTWPSTASTPTPRGLHGRVGGDSRSFRSCS